MANGGPLDEHCSSRLLFAAATMDLILLLLLLRLIGPDATAEIQRMLPPLPAYALWMICGFILLLLFWFVTELILGGASLGRLAVGLSLRNQQGDPLTAGRRTSRCMRKVSMLGLGGLRLNTAASYDVATEARWFSEMAPRSYRPAKTWRLAVASGPLQGRSVTFGELQGFRSKHAIKIGRDPRWSDLVFPQSETRVSSKHCVLQLRADGLYLIDWGTGGKGSSNGTRLHSKMLTPGKWVPVGHASHFYVAGISIKIDR